MSVKRTRPAAPGTKTVLPDPRLAAVDHLTRIATLSADARTTWFSLLGVLLFVGITLLGFSHIDFYGYDRQTYLPIIGVPIPTRFFFIAAPLLVAANYIYFHLYLIRLWDALGEAPARVNGGPLGRAIPPWLVTDAALWLRNWRRRDECTDPRPLEGAAAILNLSLTWGFGIIVGTLAWWLAAVSRDVVMTGLAAFALTAMLLAALASLGAMWQRMARGREPKKAVLATVSACIIGTVLGFPTYWRTTEPAPWMYRTISPSQTAAASGAGDTVPIFANRNMAFFDRLFTLAAIDLEGAMLVERKDTWVPISIARDDYRSQWCEREQKPDCTDFGPQDENRFAEEFRVRQESALATLRRPDWHNPGQTKPDLRGANLSRSFLIGIDLTGARLDGANLAFAQLDFANLNKASLTGTTLTHAQLQNARLNGAELTRAKLEDADLRGAAFLAATLTGAQLQRALLGHANLTQATLDHADFGGANLEAAVLAGATLQDAHFKDAILDQADFTNSTVTWEQLQTAQIGTAIFDPAIRPQASASGATPPAAILLSGPAFDGSDPAPAIGSGSAARNIDLTALKITDPATLNTLFLDDSVAGQQEALAALGQTDRPCQWQDTRLSDTEFFGRWRGWIETAQPPEDTERWARVAPAAWKDVKPIPPGDGCSWPNGPSSAPSHRGSLRDQP